MMVSSNQLMRGAAEVRRRKRGPVLIPAVGFRVTAAQLDTAAQILKDAEPSICNGNVQERPGFIEADQQTEAEVLHFQVGILPSTTYRIDRKGEIL